MFLPEQGDVTPDFWRWWKFRVAHVRASPTAGAALSPMHISPAMSAAHIIRYA